MEKQKKQKVVGVILAILGVIILTIAGLNIADYIRVENAKNIVLNTLNEYYNDDFEVISVSKKHNTILPHKSQFYKFIVMSKELQVNFEANFRPSTGTVGDNYEYYKYGKLLDEEIKSINPNENGWELDHISADGIESGCVKKRYLSLDNYIKHYRPFAHLQLTITGDDDRAIAESIYFFVSQLRDHGYPWEARIQLDKKFAFAEDYSVYFEQSSISENNGSIQEMFNQKANEYRATGGKTESEEVTAENIEKIIEELRKEDG